MDVRRAKRIARDIDNKADVLALEDDCEADDEVGSIDNDFESECVGPEKPNRTGLDRTALAELGASLKASRACDSTGQLSYVAKKRLSIDKFIDNAAAADSKATMDFMSMMVAMDERAAKREELRLERDGAWRREQVARETKSEADRQEREDRREQLHLMIFSKLCDKK
ncbi:hypothetical protein DYB30_007247 [Aphanomyces astaci]|uniref:Uncharacterized protein n=1 Tax=Aphanomyces astaci TaxID=112090 RepID=A0A397DZX0_APHAT|nr:hypothetical protein DYB30_007247 [Aphanomyces astaci]RHZ29650.1 hypothetical protein DYB31_011957 [Aphanomyces astaci]